jgi:tRNA 2-selenouridine synthase
LKAKLACLKELYGWQTLARWIALVDAGNWNELVPDLLRNHYDPAYLRSTSANFRKYAEARALELHRLDQPALQRLAADLVAAPDLVE